MDTVLLVLTGKSEPNYHTELDLFEDVPINLVIQEGDLGGFERRSNYTKTFRIPATAKNSKVFKNFFEINGNQYNPLRSLPCVVQSSGNDVFKGTLRLNGVYRNELYDEYEVYIIQELVDFTNLVGDLTLAELNWGYLNHEVNYDNITTSWEADSGSTAGLLNGTILYPMINYGLEYTGSVPDFDYCIGSSPCFSNSGNALPERIWRPSIRVADVFEKIIEDTGYVLESDFINSAYFRSLYMDLGYSNSLGINVPDQTENLNLFRVYCNPSTTYNYSSALAPSFAPVRFRTLNPDGYDLLGNFELPSQRFAVPKTGTYGFNIRFAYTKVGTFNEELLFSVFVKKSTDRNNIQDGTTIASDVNLEATDNDKLFLLPFSATLNAGEFVEVFIQFSSSAGAGYNQFQTLILKPYDSNYEAPVWNLYESPQLTSTSVDISLNMPQDIKAIDFLKNIVNMFNMVFLVKDERVITVEPFPSYFDDDNRTVKDWTGKLDISKDYQISPFSFDLPKEVKYTYLSGGDEVQNLYYENNFNRIFGDRVLIDTTTNILQGEEIFESIYSPTPTDTISGSDYMIMPKIHKINDEGNKVPLNTKPHLFFWVGNRYCYTDSEGTTEGSWYLKSGTTEVEWNTYPAVSHLSKLDAGQSWQQFSDLNFGKSWDFFANNNSDIGQFTKFNIFDTFHAQSYEEKYSEEARKFSGRVYLQPNEVGQIDLRDKIYIKDSFFRIETINEASLTDDKLTEVNLIKDLGGFEYTQPPAPTYPISPNQAYPTPTPTPSPPACNSFTVYGPSTSSSDVCDRTTSTSTIYSTSSSLSDGSRVFTDSSCSSPVQVARYFDETSTSANPIFVVSLPDGTIASYTCR